MRSHAGNLRARFVAEGADAMEHVANLGTDFQELPALDPCGTVRQADLALLNRRREEAAALITQPIWPSIWYSRTVTTSRAWAGCSREEIAERNLHDLAEPDEVL
jgi:hypothetical protein